MQSKGRMHIKINKKNSKSKQQKGKDKAWKQSKEEQETLIQQAAAVPDVRLRGQEDGSDAAATIRRPRLDLLIPRLPKQLHRHNQSTNSLADCPNNYTGTIRPRTHWQSAQTTTPSTISPRTHWQSALLWVLILYSCSPRYVHHRWLGIKNQLLIYLCVHRPNNKPILWAI